MDGWMVVYFFSLGGCWVVASFSVGSERVGGSKLAGELLGGEGLGFAWGSVTRAG